MEFNHDHQDLGAVACLYIGKGALQLVNDEKLDKGSTELSVAQRTLEEVGSELRIIYVNGWDEHSRLQQMVNYATITK